MCDLHRERGQLIIDETDTRMDGRHYNATITLLPENRIRVKAQKAKFRFSMQGASFDVSEIADNSKVLARSPYPWSKKKLISKDGYVEMLKRSSIVYTSNNYVIITHAHDNNK